MICDLLLIIFNAHLSGGWSGFANDIDGLFGINTLTSIWKYTITHRTVSELTSVLPHQQQYPSDNTDTLQSRVQ